jgi:ribonuclease BN (tRNA processing enzyme)
MNRSPQWTKVAQTLRIIFLVTFAIAAASATSADPQTSASAPSAASHTQVVILGAGTPAADPDNSGPAVAVVANGAAYLVDCGPGVVRRAAAAERKGVAALAQGNLRIVFITHLHTDHTLGYPDLIFTTWGGRAEPLEAYGPPGLRNMTDHIEAAWQEDIDIRTNGLEQKNRTGYKVNVHEIEPGVVYKDQNVTVTAFPVAHGSWKHAFGYKFETADRTIVISGDTGPTDAIVQQCHRCDILLHEVYSESGFASTSPKSQKYFSHFHTSSAEVAREASDAKPGLLVLYHQMSLRRGAAANDEIAAEVKQHYSGNVVSAHDLDIY